MWKRTIIISLGMICCSTGLLAKAAPEQEPQAQKTPVCPGPLESVTDPQPVDMNKLLESLGRMKTLQGKSALDMSEGLKGKVKRTFDTQQVKTKMEQFYRLLWDMHEGYPSKLGKEIDLEAKTVEEVLLNAAVFTDENIPKRIKGVNVQLHRKGQPRYEVSFSRAPIKIPLNRGEGFYAFDRGKCQHTKALIFNELFSFTLRLKKNGNLLAQNFKGVDIYGDFGSRGIVDIDLEYVSLRSVEFFAGSKLGQIKAYVSREEFRQNDHNFLLRMITKFVGDESIQPIDW